MLFHFRLRLMAEIYCGLTPNSLASLRPIAPWASRLLISSTCWFVRMLSGFFSPHIFFSGCSLNRLMAASEILLRRSSLNGLTG